MNVLTFESTGLFSAQSVFAGAGEAGAPTRPSSPVCDGSRTWEGQTQRSSPSRLKVESTMWKEVAGLTGNQHLKRVWISGPSFYKNKEASPV